MNGSMKMSRREFLKGGAIAGGSLIIGMYLPLSHFSAALATPETSFSPNAFIRIDTDETVTIIVTKSEMGQGVYTSLPMIIAEELECDWKSIRVESAPVAPVFNSPVFGAQLTGGSTSIRTEWERLAKAGAIGREMLIAAAARTWNVVPETCHAENGRVINSNGKSLSYGDLVKTAATMTPPRDAPVKSPDAYKLIGKPAHRLDGLAKANGSAQFGLDVNLPGMLTAVISRSPVFGGKIISFNSTKAKAVPGVTDVVQITSGVAVIATGFWEALKGREALEISWSEGEWADLNTPALVKEYATLSATQGLIARKDGDPGKEIEKAAKRLNAEYQLPYLAHATLEPNNCVVDLKAESCDVWIGTQYQTECRNTAARISGVKPETINIHTTFLGGGFGRRATPLPHLVDALEVAKAVKLPIKLVLTREDDMQAGYYRPQWYDRLSAGLDESGNLIAWRHTIVGQSIATGTPFEAMMIKDGVDRSSVEGAQDIPYSIPNILVDLHSPKKGVPVFFWRSVGHSHTAFVVESFLDEAARAAGKDPFEFRRALLADKPRHRGVLELAAQKAGWGTPLAAGRGRGIAVHESFGSFVAQVAEVSVASSGEVRVHRVICAVDCGRIVNPDIIRAQMESGIVFGLSAALHGKITLKAGRVEQSNYQNYPVIRMDEMPEIEVHIVPSTENPGGCGEPGVPPIAPAVVNAICAATGARIRSLPIQPESILSEIKK
ncbi:MAG: xanthine dehydrogenase family protein molybdopterin-binding subunit [Candidatus Riflebacteria bacterium]|nr:xanthine dehydrogenase family protein molybdopterin-binding subunit [Candidatus Riflebacteria bacterium]